MSYSEAEINSMAREICLHRGERPDDIDAGGNAAFEVYRPLAGAVLREAERLFASRNLPAWDAPHNRSYQPVEALAKEIYDSFVYDGPAGTKKPAWTPGGNGTKQDEARSIARRRLAAEGHTPSVPAPVIDSGSTNPRAGLDWIIEDMIKAWDIKKKYHESFRTDCERLIAAAMKGEQSAVSSALEEAARIVDGAQNAIDERLLVGFKGEHISRAVFAHAIRSLKGIDVAAEHQLPIDKALNQLMRITGGREEICLYFFPKNRNPQRWRASAGNPSEHVMIGEVPAKFEVEGENLEKAIVQLTADMTAATDNHNE